MHSVPSTGALRQAVEQPKSLTTRRSIIARIAASTPYVVLGLAWVAVSAGANLVYALSRPVDPFQKTIWCAAAVIAPLTMSLFLSLALSAFRARDWSTFFSYLIGLVFCSVFSVASTYGALSHGRNESAVNVAATVTRRAEIVKQKERDEASLNALSSVRPMAAINAEISALLDSRKDLDAEGRGKCVGWLPGKAAREVCVEVSRDRVELETAKKHEDLDTKIRQATAELSALPATGARANDDAVGVVKILARFSIAVTTDDVNDILALIMVFVIESAGGLMFNAAARVWEGERGRSERARVVAAEEPAGPAPQQRQNSVPQEPIIASVLTPQPQPLTGDVTTTATSVATPATSPVVATVATSSVRKVARLKVVGGSQVASAPDAMLKSKVATWVLGLPINQATPVSQRDLAAKLGVSHRGFRKRYRFWWSAR
jgi:hypothetical protein